MSLRHVTCAVEGDSEAGGGVSEVVRTPPPAFLAAS
jgi:hypothetical protein